MGRLAIAQVVGEALNGVWSQVAVVPGKQALNEVWFQDPGLLVVAVTFEGERTEEVSGRGREFLTQLENWSKDLQIETTVEEMVQVIKKLTRNGEGVQNLILGWFNNREAVVVGYGAARVMWRREGKVGSIFSGQEGEWRVVRGQIKPGDRVLLGTAGLVGEMSETLIEEILTYDEVDQAGEELTTQVHAAQDNSAAAGLIIQVNELSETPEEAATEGEVEEVVEEKAVAEPLQEIQPTVYLKKPSKRKKMVISIGLVLLILLISSVFFGWQQRQKANQEAKEREAAAAAEAAARAQIETQAKNIPVWFNLSLLREGWVGQGLVVRQDQLLVLDGQKGLVGSVNVNTKSAEMAGGGDLVRGATILAQADKRVIVYGNQGVIEINTEKKTTGVLVKTETDWQRVVGVGLFAGNVYLLDAGAGEIWRYPAMTQGVGAKQRWLGAGVTPNLSGAVKMVIDGDVWVGTKEGEVLRFRRGAKEAFSLKGLTEPIGELASLYTDAASERLYVLDRGKTKVVAVDKEGNFVKQYVWSGMAGVTDIAVAEKAGKLLLLSGSSVYVMEL